MQYAELFSAENTTEKPKLDKLEKVINRVKKQ